MTKCKKTHLGEINLRILTIVQPQPGKEAQMAENYSFKIMPERCHHNNKKTEREMRRKMLPTARILGSTHRGLLPASSILYKLQ